MKEKIKIDSKIMDKDTFLEKVVFGWIKKDFERLLSLRPIPYGEGNINFFLALCVLTSIEFLGGFLIGEITNSARKDFLTNVKTYIDECFSSPKDYKINILLDVFRNGLAHEFFPRGSITRDVDNKRPAMYKNKINNSAILNAETLANDFIESLEHFREKLTEEKYNQRMSQLRQSVQDKMERENVKTELNELKLKNVDGIYHISSEISSCRVSNSDTMKQYRTDPPFT